MLEESLTAKHLLQKYAYSEMSTKSATTLNGKVSARCRNQAPGRFPFKWRLGAAKLPTALVRIDL